MYLQKAFTLVQPATVFVVYSVTTTTQQNNHFAIDGVGSQRMAVNLGGQYPVANVPAINAGANLQAIDSLKTNNVFYTYTCVFSGASSAMYIGGSLKTSGNAGTNSPDGITLGTLGTGAPANASPVDIGELFLVSNIPSSSNQSAAESYLKSKWSTP